MRIKSGDCKEKVQKEAYNTSQTTEFFHISDLQTVCSEICRKINLATYRSTFCIDMFNLTRISFLHSDLNTLWV